MVKRNDFSRKENFSVWVIVILCLLGLLVYSNTFKNSFHLDDDPSIVNNLKIRNLFNLKAIWDFWPSRFITYFSLALNYHFSKLNVFSYHIFNLIVHLASSILVFWLCLSTFSTPVMKKEQKFKASPKLIAFFASLIFLTHPVQTQAVTYITQRASSLASFFYLGSLAFYSKARLIQTTQLSKANLYKSRFYFNLAIFFASFAMFTKEIAITLPFAILLYEFCFYKEKQRFNWKVLFPFFATFLIIPLTMFLTNSVNFKQMHKVTESISGISPLAYLFTQFRVMLTYIRLLFLPLNQNVDYDYPLNNLFELPVIFSLVLLGLVILLALRLFKKYRIFSFAIFLFFLVLLPESSIIPIKDVIFEHRLYLAMAGFSLFLANSIFYLLGDRKLLLIVIISGYSILTYERNFIWKDEISLWNDTVRKSPHKARVYLNRGFAYKTKGNFDQAFSDYNKAIEINTQYTEAYLNRGTLYYEQGDYTKAFADYSQAIQIDPTYAEAYNNRGGIAYAKGDYAQAILDSTVAIQIKPDYAQAYYNRGNAYESNGKIEEAIADFTQALKINPDYVQAYNDRALLYKKKGNLEQALSDYNQAIQVEPKNGQLYIDRADLYVLKNNLGQAISDYSKAIQIDPDYINAYLNRGNAYALKDDLARAIFDYNKVIQMDPKSAIAYNNRAAVYLRKQEYGKAWEDVGKAQQLGYKINPELLENLKHVSGKAR